VPARRLDAVRVAAAVSVQGAAIASWLATLGGEAWAGPSSLPEWTVAELVAHLTQTLRTIYAAPVTGEPPGSLVDYLSRLAGAADEIHDREVAAAAGRTGAELTNDYNTQLDAAQQVMTAISPTAIVRAPRGPLRIGEFLATRAMELVVHADDLGRARPDNAPPLEREALAVACRLLADVLATQAPGHTVELRVPPYAAVQCVSGPRHTRGTPPNVVETDPRTWLRLATGRTTFAAAARSGAVTASGERSDLSPYLPVLS